MKDIDFNPTIVNGHNYFTVKLVFRKTNQNDPQKGSLKLMKKQHNFPLDLFPILA